MCFRGNVPLSMLTSLGYLTYISTQFNDMVVRLILVPIWVFIARKVHRLQPCDRSTKAWLVTGCFGD